MAKEPESTSASPPRKSMRGRSEAIGRRKERSESFSVTTQRSTSSVTPTSPRMAMMRVGTSAMAGPIGRRVLRLRRLEQGVEGRKPTQQRRQLTPLETLDQFRQDRLANPPAHALVVTDEPIALPMEGQHPPAPSAGAPIDAELGFVAHSAVGRLCPSSHRP